ncbi:3,4-dihydroxy-2-butanone 4-phosphate synthase [Kiloniella litopenaei]|uniref:3,4-dihydroxy-2-butanone 4-phosphate synthase n=1 Tax=Kiloniella litopenaei TaxID=1549748 RepID=A0A0M2R5Z4_9PROT|nr:3,4-dihydroxy-2-butanone-4-phosphate synthase [Kiloniella litopenaei]KKJ75874.1 3,4-dihydroxy-2-butanone 4-phosphate synthase [Kiloniella litopenaei]
MANAPSNAIKSFSDILSPPEEIIEEARNGHMFILVDDENRENEGDLVIPAQMATPEAINFMAKYGRGLICLALCKERVEELGLTLMAQKNGTRHETAFTVSIEAKEGVTTGISAPDRARTISVATDPSASPDDIVTPGHVFPLVARDGGVLVRTGHTEAAVDIARLAGLNPAGVICEIMNDDGTMARRDDLIEFAQIHKLKIATIADLIAYRRKHDHLIEKTLEDKLHSKIAGEFNMAVYVNNTTYAEHIALWKGDISSDDPLLVRMHALNVLDDVLIDSQSGKAGDLHNSMKMIDKEGRGVIVLLREPSPKSLSDAIKTRLGEPVEANHDLRDYGVGAQILLDLGVQQMILLTNSQKNIVGLDGYGLSVVEQRPIVETA